MKIRIVSIILLLSVFILNTPRSWWHNCKHKIESSNNLGKSFKENTSDCDFCDYDLSAFTIHTYDFFIAKKSFISHQSIDLCNHLLVSSINLNKLRGPPSLIL